MFKVGDYVELKNPERDSNILSKYKGGVKILSINNPAYCYIRVDTGERSSFCNSSIFKLMKARNWRERLNRGNKNAK